VDIATDDPTDAQLVAAQIVACRPECEMVTSTIIVI
jgi:hypothetical protein